eukprot:TRINITY_DN1754_c0_g1_i12.p1 TRINITY_DN1754_c0_g1~~TRINITY_DN1754_c0_g1_i12.p1  ORF type:complete len:247 (-),score=53.05 TRINITY_DN1754_c0_g1_i12:220-960(-)
MCLDWKHEGKTSLVETLNGVVAGLAGITPASGFIDHSWALLVSIIIGFSSYYGVTILKEKLQIDDALDVVVVHGFTSVIGSMSNGFFASTDINPSGQKGLIQGHGIQIAYQLLGIVVAISWTTFWTFSILKILEKIFGGLRVSLDVEKDGLGWEEHGEFIDDFEFFHRKKFIPLTLTTVEAHSSRVRYQYPSDDSFEGNNSGNGDGVEPMLKETSVRNNVKNINVPPTTTPGRNVLESDFDFDGRM